MADEFRVKVAENALKLDPKTPRNFKWDNLHYSTQNNEHIEQHKDMEQLKRINKEEQLKQKDEQEVMDTTRTSGNTDEELAENEVLPT